MAASLFFGHFVLKFWTFRFGDYTLKKELKKLNIQDKEIENLERILSREKPDNNELGSETKGWISKMKDLGVAVSAEILATMIKSFLGIVD